MEAASIPTGPAASQRIRALIGTYGLTLVLLALPIVYAIQDLVDDGNLVRLGENLTAGISNGAIWALVAIGYTLVYGIVELINFAHGDVFMMGAMAALTGVSWLGLGGEGHGGLAGALGMALVLLASMAFAGLLNRAIDRVAYGWVFDFVFFHIHTAGWRFDWYVFNLADVAIVAGVIGLLYESLFAGRAAKAP